MVEALRQLSSLSEEFVEVSFRHDPVLATSVGIHDYDAQLPDDSPAGVAARAAWLADFRSRFEREVDAGSLPPAQRVDHALLRSRIAALTIEHESLRDHARNPAQYPECALRGVFLLLARSFAPLAERKEAIVSRLMAVPAYLEGAFAGLEPAPEPVVRVALTMARTGPPFVDEVVRSLRRSFPGEAERIEHAGNVARAAFFRYHDRLEAELLPRAQDPLGVGRETLARRLTEEHGLDLTPEDVEALALEQLATSRAALEAEAHRIDPARGWREQLANARRNAPEPNRLLEAYAREVDRALRFVRERGIAPSEPDRLEIVETPLFQRMLVPLALYLPPAVFDESPEGLLWVTPVDRSRTKDEQQQQLHGHCHARLPLTVVHEAYPGRHLQVSNARRASSRLRQLANDDCFARGWAHYCEELMYEEGFYPDPATRLFQLRDAVWRACRAVLDVRLHTGRAGFEQAVQMLVDEAMLERMNAVSEVQRYLLTPALPMSYLVGRVEITRLRDAFRSKLGAAFDLHEFHAAMLSSGTLPIGLVRADLEQRFGRTA